MKVCFVFLRFFLAGAGFCFVTEANAQLSVTVLHSFQGGTEGQQPYAGLVQATDGLLYGTTYLGGSNNAGVVFKVNPNGSGNTPIYHFSTNGSDPLAYPSGLIEGADGALYGTTAHGGAAGFGSVFRIQLDGTGYAVVHSFNSSGGYSPSAVLVQGSDGALFGTTQFGGSGGFGTVFRINTNGTGFGELYAFGSATNDPQSPQAPLIQGTDGALYGTSVAGGASAVGGDSGYGTVFKINTNGTGMTVLHSFMPTGGDGQRPFTAGLVQRSNGVLYGITQEGGNQATGGSSGFGTVFRLNPDGTGYTILHSFNPAAGDGKYPNSSLVIGNDGALYGSTEMGGSNNLGVVFRLEPDSSNYTVLHHLKAGSADGSNPKAPLVRASDGGLFGTAQFGGDRNFGVIFRLGPAPATISSIKSVSAGMQISLTGAPHFDYRIEGSTNHVDWVALTNLHNATGEMQFTDPDARKFSQRFYRAAWVP
jgi:uncharacterized repeat protein (TIGR03803 family)